MEENWMDEINSGSRLTPVLYENAFTIIDKNSFWSSSVDRRSKKTL